MSGTTDQPPVRNTAEWREQVRAKAARSEPSFFHLRAQLPEQGRTNIVLGATPLLSVVLKTYASGGENELHAHPNEDHLFIVMSGRAEFFGPHDEKKIVGKNDCVLLPRKSYYRFRAIEGEDPLVMVRVGATTDPAADSLERIGMDGLSLDGFSEANKEIPVVLSDSWFD